MISRAEAFISGAALRRNYKILSALVPDLKFIPMVKADAYGHGSGFVGDILSKQKNTFALGVATFQEGRALRESLKASRVPIIVFSDSVPWSEERSHYCIRFGLEPVFSEITSLLAFQADPKSKTIAAHLEFNTGMNRLGIPPESLGLVRFYPKTAFTHLADADSPNSPLTREQLKRFSKLVPEIKSRFPRTLLHFANSSTLWNHSRYPLLGTMDLARPGLSLYGIRPFESARNRGLSRVMCFRVRVMQRLFLEKGERVGYGGSYQCKRANGEWIAILGGGYADGVFRSLGNHGVAYFGSKKLRFRGRVSMDLSAIECTPRLKVGDSVELWGDRVDPYEQSGLAGTIPYEITTRIGSRVERIYEY